MDWMTFTSNVLKFAADLVGSLAWPAVAVWLVWRFRLEIKPLINKLTSLKLGSVEAKFALDTEKALGDIQATPAHQLLHAPAQLPLPIDPQVVQPPATSQYHDDAGVMFSLSEPIDDDWPTSLELQGVGDDVSAMRNSALVAMAWRDVEGSVDKLAKALGNRITYNKLHAASKLRAIEQIGVLQPRFIQALRSLQKLRNEVLHTPGFEPTDESTKAYLEGVRSARLVLKDATLDARKWENVPYGQPGNDGPESPNSQ